MKLFSLVSILVFVSALLNSIPAHAGWWEIKVAFAKSIGCKTSKCTSHGSTAAPDKLEKKKIALTFDDGPDSQLTPRVLEILQKHNIKATFFVLGKNVAANKDLLKQMVAQGHVIGSHSWSHPNFWELNERDTSEELLSTEKALGEIGVKPVYFRFPNGNSTGYALNVLEKRKYIVTGWNVDTCDWGFSSAGVLSAQNNKICNGVEKSVSNVRKYLFEKITRRGSGIILLHDVQKTTVDNLDSILTELQNEQYEFYQINDQQMFPHLNQH
jgi:peptidoglycan-N-acetylglucosamine deacetylase